MRLIKLFPWRPALFVAAFPLILAGALLFTPPRQDLSALQNAGAGYQVRLLRDRWGVPHIFGQTDPDVAYGLAYAHAEDDFLTIQQTLIAARGRLGTVAGVDGAPVDYFVQFLRLWDTVEAGYDTQLEPATRALVEAYAAGLNVYASQHPNAALPGLFPVSGKDIVAGSVLKTPLFFGLDQVLGELFSASAPAATATPPANSNAFAVGPARTADGSTFLAVNSHQPWTGPVAWYEAHLHSAQGWDAAGGLFPGTPVIIHGFNRDLGWAFTVNHPDLIDVYTLEINPANPNQYKYDGQWRDLEVRDAALTVKLFGNFMWTVHREALWSIYGPVVRQGAGASAVRYAGMGTLGVFQQLYHLNKARNLDEWKAAMREGQLPMFNAGYADRAGNILYLYNGLLPLRAAGYDWSGPVPGDTSATLWTQYLPFDQLPQVLNPPAGFVVNANSTPFSATVGAGNPDPAAYAPSFGIETRPTNRSLRLRELFSADPAVTADDFYRIKFDMQYAAGSDVAAWRERLLADPPADPALRPALEVLRAWDLAVTPENRGAALMVLTLVKLQGPAKLNLSQLVGNSVTQTDLKEAFTQAALTLWRNFGRFDVPWADVNRLRRGRVDLGLGGGPDIVHAAYGDLGWDGRLTGNSGDALIFLVRWDAAGRVSARSIHQFGSATLDANAPHYADQAPGFARMELKPVWLEEADIRANLEREYQP